MRRGRRIEKEMREILENHKQSVVGDSSGYLDSQNTDRNMLVMTPWVNLQIAVSGRPDI